MEKVGNGHALYRIGSVKDYWLRRSGCQKDYFLFGTEIGKGQVKNTFLLMTGADLLDDQTKHFCVSASYRCDFSTDDRALEVPPAADFADALGLAAELPAL